MKTNQNTVELPPARKYAPGIGDAVANRTINRKILRTFDIPVTLNIEFARKDDQGLDTQVAAWALSTGYQVTSYEVNYGDSEKVKLQVTVTGRKEVETWEDVAYRVALGNSLLHPDESGREPEFNAMHHHLRQASLLMSGRHLQHGDAMQPTRNQEVFTNCATSACSFLTFYLLLNGSGVGRAYDDALMKVDWNFMPIVTTAIRANHPDVKSGEIKAMTAAQIERQYKGRSVHRFDVPDSREGWTKALEKIELMTFQREFKEDVLLLDFSAVRERGAPIAGMQDRPASGPGPLMSAIENIARVREANMVPWEATMHIDHYLSECVLVGGARRAARMSTKTWRDPSVLDFIKVKQDGGLWSSNNSVTVDAEFWGYVKNEGECADPVLAEHAKLVFESIANHSYYDNTGEPGTINQDKLVENNVGLEAYMDGMFAGSKRYQLDRATGDLTQALVQAVVNSPYKMITNPCGEINLLMLGGYCVIADVVPYHAQNDDDAEAAFRVAARALIRTNLMDALYGREVRRTNRIGVGMTGVHEYAWTRFGFGFRDLIDEQKSKEFWMMLSRFSRAVKDEAAAYSLELGVAVPHTTTTIKPAGTTSKLFSLSEGAHLPSMKEYVRWVQFENTDPLIAEYAAKGYPVRKLKSYSGTTIVGFPTRPEICGLGMGDKLVTAAEATPDEQYQYLRLMEKYWIVGVDEAGVALSDSGGQVSYTLKYDPNVVSFEEFKSTLLSGQSSIKCCSVMQQSDTSAYEYLPEEQVTKAAYELIVRAIQEVATEDISMEHISCDNGACPVDFKSTRAA
jgi:adenosylcobalamin-dependent ribonucleoside-triphosphate reductase